MKNYPAEVQMYVTLFLSTYDSDSTFDELCEKNEVDRDKFLEYIKEELLITSESNLIDTGSPTLLEHQYSKLIMECFIKYHLDSMVKDNLIESKFDVEAGQMVYRLKEEDN